MFLCVFMSECSTDSGSGLKKSQRPGQGLKSHPTDWTWTDLNDKW